MASIGNCFCYGLTGFIDTYGGALYTPDLDVVEFSPTVKKVIGVSAGLFAGASFYGLGGILLSGYYEYRDRYLLGFGLALCFCGVVATKIFAQHVLLEQERRLERIYGSLVPDYSTDGSSSSQASV